MDMCVTMNDALAELVSMLALIALEWTPGLQTEMHRKY